MSSDSEEDARPTSLAYLLHDAAESGDVAIMASLVSDEAGIATVGMPTIPHEMLKRLLIIHDDDDCSPLHLALLNGRVECAKILLSAGAPAEGDTLDGSPPLHIATCLGLHAARRPVADELVELLLVHGAEPMTRDHGGRTALHWAAVAGLEAAAAALIAAGEEVRDRILAAMALDNDAGEPAMAAGAAGAAEPPPHVPSLAEMADNGGNTPLHLAARFGHQAVLLQLLQPNRSGADVTALTRVRNRDGFTALHLAALAGHALAVHAIVAAAPESLLSVDRRGRNTAQLAQRKGHTDLALAVRSLAHDISSGHGVPAVPSDDEHAAGGTAAAAEGTSTALHAVGRSGGSRRRRDADQTLILAPDDCLLHRTHPEPFRRGGDVPPPENINRLLVLTSPGTGVLHTDEFSDLRWQTSGVPAAALSDVLRVHDWPYVQRVQKACRAIPDLPTAVDRLDPDTAISHGTYQAALVAAGSVCAAVDSVMEGQARNVFCAVRPPGHHAGPSGVVTNANDAHGSHGFCIFSNIAIGAAYAMHMYRRKGIKRVAILDFDVHHGNGTEACVANTVPGSRSVPLTTPYSQGVQVFPTFKPWLDTADRDNIFFASVQGYGHRSERSTGWFYPGSGATLDNAPPAPAATPAAENIKASEALVEDPFGEFCTSTSDPVDPSLLAGPRIINVGIPGPGAKTRLWQRAWRDKILPAVANFRPDIILISAGFDAHRKEDLNLRFIGVTEHDYEWLTEQIVQLANKYCHGRVVSVLEGGYNLRGGGTVSTFARSVAAHVRALNDLHAQPWDPSEGEFERRAEAKKRDAKAASVKGVIPPLIPTPAIVPPAVAVPPSEVATAGSSGAGGTPAAVADIEMAGASPAAVALPATAFVGTPVASTGAAVAAEEEEGGSKRRRRGSAVDYAAMNAVWEREQAAKAQGPLPGTAPPSDMQ